MEDIIAPISKELLKAELTEDKRLRMTIRVIIRYILLLPRIHPIR